MSEEFKEEFSTEESNRWGWVTAERAEFIHGKAAGAMYVKRAGQSPDTWQADEDFAPLLNSLPRPLGLASLPIIDVATYDSLA